jgi:hypothetical protein
MIISEGEKNRIRKMHRGNSIIKEQRGVGPTPTETLQMGDKGKEEWKIKETKKEELMKNMWGK